MFAISSINNNVYNKHIYSASKYNNNSNYKNIQSDLYKNYNPIAFRSLFLTPNKKPKYTQKSEYYYKTNGIQDEDAKKLASLPPKLAQKADIILELTSSATCALVFSTYDDKDFDWICTAIKKGGNPFELFILDLVNPKFQDEFDDFTIEDPQEIEYKKEMLLNLLDKGMDPKEIINNIDSDFPPLYYEYLTRLLDMGFPYEKINDIAMLDHKKANELLANAEQKNKEIDKLMEKMPDKIELDKYDRHFLRNNMFYNKYYCPEEYLKYFIYFKNLTTVNGDRVLGKDRFMGVKKQYNFLSNYEKAQIEDYIYENIKAILNIDPSSEESNYIQTFIELVQKGEINLNSICYASPARSFNLSSYLKEDLDLLYKVYDNNTDKTKLKDEIKEAYIPTYSNIDEAHNNTKNGDVFQLENEKYIRIKTQNNSYGLHITKDTYFKLFPPVERFATCQHLLGDCYCLETFMALYMNKKTRCDILKRIYEYQNGYIGITLSDKHYTYFSQYKLDEINKDNVYSDGALGFKLFEYAYSKLLMEEKKEEFYETVLYSRYMRNIENFINDNNNNIFLDIETGNYCTFEKEKEKKAGKIKNNEKYHESFNTYLLGKGGLISKVLEDLDYKNIEVCEINSRSNKQQTKEILDRIKQDDFFDNNLLFIGIDNHAYYIEKEIVDGKNVFILYNPHNQGLITQINNPYALIEKYVSKAVILPLSNF